MRTIQLRSKGLAGGGLLVLTLTVTLLLLVSVFVAPLTGRGSASEHPNSKGATIVADVRAGSPLSITSFTVNGTTFFVEAPVWFNVTAAGGAPPYSYVYVGLPPGCTTQNVSSLSCYPSSAQHYVVQAFVYDTAGNQANATRNFTVSSGFGLEPAILSFHAYPSTLSVNNLTYLNVDAVSRSGTPTSDLAFVFLGLPPGCGTFNQTNLSCIPTQPGEYEIWVRVTDSYSQFNQSYAFINVTGKAATATTNNPPLPPFDVDLIIGSVVALIAIVGVVVYVRYIGRPPTKPASLPGKVPTAAPRSPADPDQTDSSISPGWGAPASRSATVPRISRWRSTSASVCWTERVHCSSGPVPEGIRPRFRQR